MLMKHYYLWIYVFPKTSLTCPLHCNVLMFFTSSNFKMNSFVAASRTVLRRAIDAPFHLIAWFFFLFYDFIYQSIQRTISKTNGCNHLFFCLNALLCSLLPDKSRPPPPNHGRQPPNGHQPNHPKQHQYCYHEHHHYDYATIIWKPLQDSVMSPENLMIWRVTQKITGTSPRRRSNLPSISSIQNSRLTKFLFMKSPLLLDIQAKSFDGDITMQNAKRLFMCSSVVSWDSMRSGKKNLKYDSTMMMSWMEAVSPPMDPIVCA